MHVTFLLSWILHFTNCLSNLYHIVLWSNKNSNSLFLFFKFQRLVKVLSTQLAWSSDLLSRLAGQDTLTALSPTIPCARLLLNSSNTLNNQEISKQTNWKELYFWPNFKQFIVPEPHHRFGFWAQFWGCWSFLCNLLI